METDPGMVCGDCVAHLFRAPRYHLGTTYLGGWPLVSDNGSLMTKWSSNVAGTRVPTPDMVSIPQLDTLFSLYVITVSPPHTSLCPSERTDQSGDSGRTPEPVR